MTTHFLQAMGTLNSMFTYLSNIYSGYTDNSIDRFIQMRYRLKHGVPLTSFSAPGQVDGARMMVFR